MNYVLGPQRERELLEREFSRRHFFKVASLMGAAASLPFSGEAALSQLSQVAGIPHDAVKINANENPLGPCPEAVAAIVAVLKEGGRYHYDLTEQFRKVFASQENLSVNQVQAFAGSSAALIQSVLAFTSPANSFVTADPTFEAGERAAKFIGAKVHRVPLTKSFAHDVKAMAAADPNAGLIYLCNPNNPTGTLTPDAEIDWLAEHLPSGCVLLLDEAYGHIAGCRMRADLVSAGKRVVVLRTFSKIYGMAGIRAGAALAQPELLSRITQYSSGIMPITGMVGATASLQAPGLVPARRKIVADTRDSVFQFLDRHGFTYVPSVSNKFMVDVKQPGERVVSALQKENIYVGRIWPSWPTFIRVSIGTSQEMQKFQQAFLKVMA